jgi:hypothetical protein
MATVHQGIDDRLREFVLAQPMYFVASAPAGPDGHVNVSPKGMVGTFAVLGPLRVAYADFTGSGAETAAHLRDNGRLTVMFCAFAGQPKIVRLYGQGRYLRPGDDDFAALRPHFDLHTEHGLRGIVDVALSRVSDSCGFAVPNLAYAGERGLLDEWAAHRSAEELDEYRCSRNATSIDGLPALAG